MASPAPSRRVTQHPEGKEEPAAGFATRAGVKEADGISKSKLILLGGGLAIAVLFFVFTAVVGKSPKKQARQAAVSHSKQNRSRQPAQRQCNATHGHPAHTRAGQCQRPARARRHQAHPLVGQWRNQLSHCRQTCCASSLGTVPSFADTQQKWEDPAPYGGPPPAETPQTQQNGLKEPSLVFVRSQAQDQAGQRPGHFR